MLDHAPVLLSYWYFKNIDVDAWIEEHVGPGGIFIADSGGFTADTLGVTITVDEYAAWLHRYRHHFTAAFTLDVVGDAEATWRNTAELQQRGVPVLPIFHTAEPWSFLERYVADGYPYIGLGGMVLRSRPAVTRFVARAMQIIPPHVAVHGLGIGTGRLLGDVPWYSADSSVNVAPRRFGALNVFDPWQCRWRSWKIPRGVREDNRANAFGRAVMTDPDLGRILRHYGFSTEVLLHPEAHGIGRNEVSDAIGFAASRVCEDWMRRRHGERVRGDSPIRGPLIYTVMGTDSRPKAWRQLLFGNTRR